MLARIAADLVVLAHLGFVLFTPWISSAAEGAAAQSSPIRGEIIIHRASAAWQSQQLQEACILPNPKDPTRLVMFYSGVADIVEGAENTISRLWWKFALIRRSQPIASRHDPTHLISCHAGGSLGRANCAVGGPSNSRG
ncbi:MAG: hypothetical protein KJ072_27770 [Verrucomicrobia bacterium]|nr:hypothetical protein [Verrucomicrobiota bacterium]